MATIVEKNTDGAAEVLSRHLKSGALAIIPCDTIYGIVGVVPSSESALRTVKGRPETKPFIQLVTLDMAKKIAVKPIPSEILALWPGPLTVIAKRSERNGTVKRSLSRASAGNVRIHTSPLGAEKEA